MVLLLAVISGIAAGAAQAWLGGRGLSSPKLRLLWVVPLAFLPQWLAFFLPATRRLVTVDMAVAALVSSQSLLLLFAWINRKQSGFWVLGIGLTLNLLVIVLNGGLMPISPETVIQLAPNASLDAWHIGQRLGATKDVVLPVAATRLWWLSDRFLLPAPRPWRVAFSLGDILIGVGAFNLLWALGGESLSSKGMREILVRNLIGTAELITPSGR